MKKLIFFEKNSKKIWRERNFPYLCNPKQQKGTVLKEFGSIAQLVQSVCLTSRGSGVRLPLLPLQKKSSLILQTAFLRFRTVVRSYLFRIRRVNCCLSSWDATAFCQFWISAKSFFAFSALPAFAISVACANLSAIFSGVLLQDETATMASSTLANVMIRFIRFLV